MESEDIAPEMIRKSLGSPLEILLEILLKYTWKSLDLSKDPKEIRVEFIGNPS